MNKKNIEINQMRRSHIIALPFVIIVIIIVIAAHRIYLLTRGYDSFNYPGGFKESCKPGARLRSYKKSIRSTWDSRGISKLFDSVNIEKPYGDPVDSISIKTSSKDYFSEKYLYTNTPCIIRDIPNDWTAMKKWSFENFKERFGKSKFRVTGRNSNLKYEYFHHYINSVKHRRDDVPMFIFDSTFADKGKQMRELLKEYTIPDWFDEDLFKCLSEEERPNFRWLLLSTRGAGTSLHIDPVSTSAWNTMIQGKKRWVLFPPETFKSEKAFDSTIRGAEWFLKEYPKYKHLPHKDFIQLPGETVFLPSDWWHITVNFEDSIAVTQNFLIQPNFSKARNAMYKILPKVYLKWIRVLNEQIDTDPEMYKKFNGKIKEYRTLDSIDYSSDRNESESDIE
jgi:histone arginine demethylase JMJD6